MGSFDSRSDPGGAARIDPRLDAVLEAAVDAIIMIDRAGRIELFSAAAQRMFGYSPEEVLGKNVNMLMPAPYHAEHDDYLRRYLQTRIPKIIGIGREVVALRKNGSRFPVNLAVGAILTSGEPRGFVGLIRDISERKQAEQDTVEIRERLAHVARLSTMGEMAAGIAHEINQPLAAIATFASACSRLIEAGNASEPELAAALGRINDEALRAGQVIQRLRVLVKKRDSRRDTCGINDLIREVLTLAQVDPRAKDIPIRLDLDESLPPIEADTVQIQQVILNLLRNALDAMELIDAREDGIWVGTRLDGAGDVLVSVSDAGPGIASEEEEHVFDPFVTTKSGGMGMGLSISRSIVTAHGGRLWFSRNGTRGMTFHFTLPGTGGEE